MQASDRHHREARVERRARNVLLCRLAAVAQRTCTWSGDAQILDSASKLGRRACVCLRPTRTGLLLHVVDVQT